MRVFKDRYGFLFWLRWIVWFTGSFVLAAAVWTKLMQLIFGAIAGPELVLTWSVAVFGSWFLLVIPFMRKKEQIWKRLNDDQERAVDAWLGGMGTFIGILAASEFLWSMVLRERIAAPGMQGIWVKAVFGTWLVVLLPFLVILYRQADRIFKTAVERQTYEPNYRTSAVPASERFLSDVQMKSLEKIPYTLPKGHVVTAILKNGERVPHVFILNRRELAGVYDRSGFDFRVSDIQSFEPIQPNRLPAYEETKWLRLNEPVNQ